MIFSIKGNIEKIINGTKTQTRRTSPMYVIGQTYSINKGRKKGIPEGRILITEKIKEKYIDGGISIDDAIAEGGYTPGTFESLFKNIYPGWIERYAYTFEFVPSLPSRVFPYSRKRASTLEERLGDTFHLDQFIVEEYCISHGLYKNTVEARVYVEIQEPNGKRWKAERIIKMRLKRIWKNKD